MTKENEDLIMEHFAAIKRHDLDRIFEIYDPDVEFDWPPPLPYRDSTKGATQAVSEDPSWQSTWLPLQPTAYDRTMDPPGDLESRRRGRRPLSPARARRQREHL